MLAQLARTMRFALRGLRKRPGFTSVVVLTVALGIAGNTAILSVLNAVLLRALPYPDYARLVVMNETLLASGRRVAASYLNVQSWKEESASFDEMVVFRTAETMNLTGGDETIRLATSFSSPAYLRLAGARAVAGRLLGEEENSVPLGHPVAVLSHGFWQRRFGGDHSIIGATIQLNGSPYTVIGVIEPEFRDPFSAVTPTDLWLPVMQWPAVDQTPEIFENRRVRRFAVLARLAPGRTIEGARMEMASISERLV